VDTGHFLGHSSGTQKDFGICKLLILSWVVVAASNLTLSANRSGFDKIAGAILDARRGARRARARTARVNLTLSANRSESDKIAGAILDARRGAHSRGGCVNRIT
jgi:hypothetical protein